MDQKPYGPRVIGCVLLGMYQKPYGPNCFENNVAGMGFHHGDRVCMFVATQKVAIGCVCEIDPNAYCFGVLVGKGNV